MIPQKTKCFAVVVHYGDVNTTNQCIDQLCQSSRVPELIIIVDHGETPFVIGSSYAKQAVVIRPDENKGYGAGFNAGLKALEGQGVNRDDIVVCMNNDVVVATDTLSLLMQAWQAQLSESLIGAQARTVNMFTGRALLSSDSLKTKKPLYFPEYIDGSFVSGRYYVWQKLTGFPEDYFLYCEDVLLSWKAFRMGIRLLVLPGLVVTHVSQQAATSIDKVYYLVRNGARLLEEEASIGWRLYWIVVNRLRFLFHAVASASPQRLVIRQALRDARAHKGGKRPSLI